VPTGIEILETLNKEFFPAPARADNHGAHEEETQDSGRFSRYFRCFLGTGIERNGLT
jgi:hypothetical protein